MAWNNVVAATSIVLKFEYLHAAKKRAALMIYDIVYTELNQLRYVRDEDESPELA